MAKMQSPHIQCCLCGFSVFSALFGMFMLSAGVCLVLNYNFLDVDTSGLPNNLNKEEAKKVVGIILICVGICSMGLGGLVSTLYFTACADRQVCKSASSSSSSSSAAAGGGGGGPEKGRDVEQGAKAGRPSSNGGHGHHRHHHHHGHHHSNGGVTPGRASPALSRRSGGGSLTNLRKASDPRGRVSGGGSGSGGLPPVALGKDGPVFSRSGGGGANGRTHTPPGGARPHGPKTRAGKKGRHGQGRYKNMLAPHPEEAGAESQSLTTAATTAAAATTTTAPTSSSGRTVFTDQGGYVNRGAQLSDDLNQARGSLAFSSSGASSVSPSVIIKVDSSHADCDDSPSHGPAREGEAAVDFRQRSEGVAEYRVRGHGDVNDNRDGDDDARYGDDEEEDESGRMSRSTVDSSDTGDGLDDASRLDSQMKQLIL